MVGLLPMVLAMAALGDVKDDATAFLEHCRASRFEEAAANFDGAMKAALPPEKLSQTWRGIDKQLGPILKTGDPREDRVANSRRVKIRCEFKTTALDALVSFNPEGKIEGFFLVPAEPIAAKAGVKRADPPYVDPGAFTERDVTVGAQDWPLPGTLTTPKPKGGTKPPLVILVHGSGPHDRDETIGPNAPFRDLAHGLASRGVAVLRYEKRTKAHRTKLVDPAVASQITVKEEVVDDVLATIAQARRFPEIDADRVFVLGHSLGGTLAPLIAQKDGRLAGLILMAASNRPPHELIRDQIDHIKKVDPEAAAELLKDESLDRTLARMKAGTARDDETVLGASVHYWKSMADVHSAEIAGRLGKLPILVLQGGRDYQVAEVDFNAFRQAVQGRAHAAFHLYPDLNHCFQKGKGKATPSEYAQQAFVDERVIRDVSSWVRSIR